MTSRFNTPLLILAVFGFLGIGAFGFGFLSAHLESTQYVHADDDENHEEAESAEAAASDTYVFVAQPGDSYTKMARKAVQIYGIDNNVNLSGAEIVFAETNLTLEAGSQVLNLGQDVSLEVDAVKKWIEEAQKLDEAAEARWNRYVANVNFNTNSVGESN